MSTRRFATALGVAALLLGAPAASALAGQDKPDKPRPNVHECEDGIDNDRDGLFDFKEDGTGDPGCGSPRDNSEADEPADEPGNGTPDPASDLQALVEEIVEGLPVDPPGGGEPPAVPAELQAVVDEVLENLPDGLPSGPPTDPPTVPAELQEVIDEVAGLLPAGPPEVPAEVQDLLDQLPLPPA